MKEMTKEMDCKYKRIVFKTVAMKSKKVVDAPVASLKEDSIICISLNLRNYLSKYVVRVDK
jgi:cellulose synthase/poly-beta-1,6-N-acetylglucosamine synthase-like glycosyltransferase